MNRYRTQVREIINRNTVVSLALEQGFNAFLPVYDGGVDFILYRETDGMIRKVQLKGRWTIDQKYKGRDIWMAFPIGDEWHLMPHDLMLEHAKADGKTLQSSSWTEGGVYSKPRPSAATIAQCAPYRFASIAQSPSGPRHCRRSSRLPASARVSASSSSSCPHLPVQPLAFSPADPDRDCHRFSRGCRTISRLETSSPQAGRLMRLALPLLKVCSGLARVV